MISVACGLPKVSFIPTRRGCACRPFSADGARIVSGSADGTLKVWDTKTGQETLTLKGHTSDVSSVAFSPDGARIISASIDGTVNSWETDLDR